jgi:hypothetical protein
MLLDKVTFDSAMESRRKGNDPWACIADGFLAVKPRRYAPPINTGDVGDLAFREPDDRGDFFLEALAMVIC